MQLLKVKGCSDDYIIYGYDNGIKEITDQIPGTEFCWHIGSTKFKYYFDDMNGWKLEISVDEDHTEFIEYSIRSVDDSLYSPSVVISAEEILSEEFYKSSPVEKILKEYLSLTETNDLYEKLIPYLKEL